jgi:nucleoside-diphosphate-sugar epimerase
LLRRGYQVTATAGTKPEAFRAHPHLRPILWDALIQPLPSVDWSSIGAILHLAVSSRSRTFPAQARSLYEVTVQACYRLLETANRFEVGRFLMASTGDALGHSEKPHSEGDAEYRPTTFYGAVKACAELLTRSFQAVLSTAVMRFYHPYGPGGDQFLINRLVRMVAEEKEIVIEGTDGIRMNPVWIDDLVSGVCLTLESKETGTFHFAGPEMMTLRGLVETIGTVIGKKPRLRQSLVDCIEQHAGLFDTTRLRLGYEPQMMIRQGIQKLIQGWEIGSSLAIGG